MGLGSARSLPGSRAHALHSRAGWGRISSPEVGSPLQTCRTSSSPGSPPGVANSTEMGARSLGVWSMLVVCGQILALWPQFPHLPCEGIGLSLLLLEDPVRSPLELSYPSSERLMFVGPPWDQPGPGNGWGGEDNGLEDSCMSGQLLCGPVAAASLLLLYQEEQQRHRSETTARCAHSPTDPCPGVGLGVGRGSAGIRFSPTLDSPWPPLPVAQALKAVVGTGAEPWLLLS